MTTIRTISGSLVVRNDAAPKIKVPGLKKDEYIVRLDTGGSKYDHPDRKTYDLRWTAWVATP